MNNQENPLPNDKEARQMKPWHKPQVTVYKMADAKNSAGAGTVEGKSSAYTNS